ncbi:5-dehydro-2-deoxygluconokinase [Mariniphaga sediminis]|uniref:5-dehydro-2-deoxygluconokinase n=1 Tax=Mariniphaga sediminis TaxID=1628158 RepID=A0A399D1U3_9BACT|nr:5-dehydro-2-deoxygluconokinase [Mariniphaga sediminis]RIH65854.1 5-dehydro-2-deoxygluconokinase [Mariniphaga sediminis]
MTDQEKKYDVITYGRSSIDLYSQKVGSRFEEIPGFHAFVGGSPLNIAVGCSRLGLKASLLSGVGKDKVGDFLIHFLEEEKVITENVPVIEGARTSAVLLGIEPPDRFPLVYYRDNCADSQINIDHVLNAGIEKSRLLEVSGTALNIEPTRSAAFLAAEIARKNEIPVMLDLDFRADQWYDIRAFGITTRAFMRNVNIVLGTEEEILAAFLADKSQLVISHQQISAPEIKGDIDEAIRGILQLGVDALIVKTGSRGAVVYLPDGTVQKVPGFPVEVVNILGAGDAFAAGFIYGYLKGWDWYKCCRMGNACGAHVVTQLGCANFTPYEKEILAFIESRGGF